MRLPALLFVTVLALLPAAARAQVIVQDPADTFLDDRTRHQQRMDRNPDKWWNGDVYDRAGASTLNDPHEFSDTPYILNPPGGQNAQPTQAAATPIPGNPETVTPHFSFDEMNEAAREGTEGEAPIDFSNPTDLESAVRNMGGNAMRLLSGDGGNDAAPQDLPQPVPSQQAAPAAVPYVPSDPRPAAPPIAPPPVEDEASATRINPADAPAGGAQPASATATAIPALEDPAAPAAASPATAEKPAFGTGIVPGRESDAPTGLTP